MGPDGVSKALPEPPSTPIIEALEKDRYLGLNGHGSFLYVINVCCASLWEQGLTLDHQLLCGILEASENSDFPNPLLWWEVWAKLSFLGNREKAQVADGCPLSSSAMAAK